MDLTTNIYLIKVLANGTLLEVRGLHINFDGRGGESLYKNLLGGGGGTGAEGRQFVKKSV